MNIDTMREVFGLQENYYTSIVSKLFVAWSHTTNNFRVSRKKNQENVVESVQKNIQKMSDIF